MKRKIIIFTKGFCMGIADVIPGISGGTIAFIMGIYGDLIDAIKSFNGAFFQRLLTFKWKEAFAQTGWKFLLPLICGIGAAIVVLAKHVSWALKAHPVLIYAFFFGLILSSVIIIAKVVKRWGKRLMATTACTAIFAYVIFGMIPLETTNALWFVFLSGAIAICAMILPGISGSFILLLLGKYEYILDAVHQRDLLVIGVLMAGMLVGILSFVRLVSWVLHRYHDPAIAVLLGLVIGSLRKIWPWQQTMSALIKGDKTVPVEQVMVWPEWSTYTIWALLLIFFGFMAATLLEKTGEMATNAD